MTDNKPKEPDDVLVRALLPFALIAEEPDLKAAILASEDPDTFRLQPWFERLCERARMAVYMRAPDALRVAQKNAAERVQ